MRSPFSGLFVLVSPFGLGHCSPGTSGPKPCVTGFRGKKATKRGSALERKSRYSRVVGGAAEVTSASARVEARFHRQGTARRYRGDPMSSRVEGVIGDRSKQWM
jgi:hypothetical protein